MSIALTLHLLATIIWVGGMFFAHMAMRPVAAQLLAPPQRLPLLAGVFKRFFFWVWVSVILLVTTGYWMIFAVFGGMGGVGIHVHVMSAVGLVMIGLFVFLYLVPFRAMLAALGRDDFKEAGHRLALIRAIVATNLVLGIAVTVVAVAGKFF